MREYVLVARHRSRRWPRGWPRIWLTQGIEVRQADEAFEVGSRRVPAGSYLVSTAQPSSRLIRNLLEIEVPQPEAFVREQDRRRKKRLGDQIYDLTAWSLPLVFDVDVLKSARPLSREGARPSRSRTGRGRPRRCQPRRSPTCCRGAAARRRRLARRCARGFACTRRRRPFTAAGRTFAHGHRDRSRGRELPTDLRETLGAIAARHGAEVVPFDSGWVDSGISLGSSDVVPLKTPRIALAWDAPTQSLSAGWARYVLERRFGLTVSARCASRRSADSTCARSTC